MSAAKDEFKGAAAGAFGKLLFWLMVLAAIVAFFYFLGGKIIEAIKKFRDSFIPKPQSQDINQRTATDGIVGLAYADEGDRAFSDFWDTLTFKWGESQGELTPYALERQRELAK